MSGDAAPAPLPVDARDLLRHHLAAVAFRFRHAVADVTEEFATFRPGHGIRTPLGLVQHIADVLDLGHGVLLHAARKAGAATDDVASLVAAGRGSASPKGASDDVPDADADADTDAGNRGAWHEALDAVFDAIERLDATLRDADWAPHDADRIRSAVHGPLVDAGTHVGQLLLLRRMAGAPAAPISYLRADVRA